MVRISDLILAVNIALGIASADQCPALGLPPVGISQVIASVNNALCGCQPCPTPPPAPPTATASPTAVDSPTPTASPTPAPTVSTWHEDNLKVPSSNCPKQITTQVRQALVNATSDYTVSQLDQQVEIDDGSGSVLTGTITADGGVQARTEESESEGACVVILDFLLTVNLSKTPAAAKYAVTVSTMNCPNRIACVLQVTSRWTRTSAPTRVRASVLGALRAALPAIP